MTAIQLYEAVLIELNKVQAPSLSLPDFIYFFNKATQQYVNETYNSYEINQQRVDDLRVVRGSAQLALERVVPAGNANLYSSVYQTYLPDDYLHILNCIVEFQVTHSTKCRTDNQLVYYGAKRLTSDASPQVINNFYLKPSYKNPYFYINNISSVDTLSGSEDLNKIDSLATRFKISCSGPMLTQNTQILVTDLNETITLPTSGQSNLLSAYRYLLKLKNQVLPASDSVGITMRLYAGLKVELIDDNNLYISMLGTDFVITQSDINITIVEDGNTDFLLKKESYVRYGNKSRARMEIRYGQTNVQAVPTSVFVDYLKTPQQISLTEDQINDIEDNSQMIEFPDYVIYEVINRLVKLVLENSGNPRVQTQYAVNQTIPTMAGK